MMKVINKNAMSLMIKLKNLEENKNTYMNDIKKESKNLGKLKNDR